MRVERLKMPEAKTKPTDSSVTGFLNKIENETKRRDALTLATIMEKITKAKPKMWGTSIVGFGDYHYKYASGHEGDTCIVGFSPRKEALTLYLALGEIDRYSELLGKLGKHKTGKGCLYIKTLDDVQLPVLEKLIRQAFKDRRQTT
jgi:uncharacterized protein YdhG (YjbR/CyaY superfamily)